MESKNVSSNSLSSNYCSLNVLKTTVTIIDNYDETGDDLTSAEDYGGNEDPCGCQATYNAKMAALPGVTLTAETACASAGGWIGIPFALPGVVVGGLLGTGFGYCYGGILGNLAQISYNNCVKNCNQSH